MHLRLSISALTSVARTTKSSSEALRREAEKKLRVFCGSRYRLNSGEQGDEGRRRRIFEDKSHKQVLCRSILSWNLVWVITVFLTSGPLWQLGFRGKQLIQKSKNQVFDEKLKGFGRGRIKVLHFVAFFFFLGAVFVWCFSCVCFVAHLLVFSDRVARNNNNASRET